MIELLRFILGIMGFLFIIRALFKEDDRDFRLAVIIILFYIAVIQGGAK